MGRCGGLGSGHVAAPFAEAWGRWGEPESWGVASLWLGDWGAGRCADSRGSAGCGASTSGASASGASASGACASGNSTRAKGRACCYSAGTRGSRAC